MTCNESYKVKINGKKYEILEPSDEYWCFLDEDLLGNYNIEFSERIDSEEQAKDPQFVKELAQNCLNKLELQDHFKLPDELILNCPENKKPLPLPKKYTFENGNPFTCDFEKPKFKTINYYYEKYYMVEEEEYLAYEEEGNLEKFEKDLKEFYSYYMFQVKLIQVKKL